MTVTAWTAKVHVTKLHAAQRQLRAAVRMFFAEEDDLAIHTVGSAAYQLLKDLKAERGRDEVGDYYLTAIFYAVRDYRRGKLPGYLANDPQSMQWIRDLAARLPITESSQFKDIVATVSLEEARRFWKQRNKVANFLKHANSDPLTSIALDEVDNLQLLMQAYGAYVDLVNDDLGAEGLVLWLYFSVELGKKDALPSNLRETAAKLEQLPREQRLRFCSVMTRELKEVL